MQRNRVLAHLPGGKSSGIRSRGPGLALPQSTVSPSSANGFLQVIIAREQLRPTPAPQGAGLTASAFLVAHA